MENNENKSNTTMKLDDTQRIKVLSPGMLVAKRFLRNKLAIVGMIIIIGMFLFAFVGGAFIPYSESQVFYTTEIMKKDYAGATYINELQFFKMEGIDVPSDTYSKTILAVTTNQNIIETRKGETLALRKLNDNTFLVYLATETRNPLAMKSEEYKAATAVGDNFFEYDNVLYSVDASSGKERIYEAVYAGLVCKYSFNPFLADTKFSGEFYENCLLAVSRNENQFTADGVNYLVYVESEDSIMVQKEDGSNFAYITNMNINNLVKGIFLTPDYKEALTQAIEENKTEFVYVNENGENEEYIISSKNGEFIIQRYQETKVIDTYHRPSKTHLLGTDANGMDMLARLMFGGRISLLIGFVVITIEVIIGVVVGGISGFFGGWVDNLLMRFVDVIYCIPSMPLYLILGSIMDHYRASAKVRIYALCVVMSMLGWVGIARIVRGQILSLREQEFMVAAEAMGLSTRRRIFRHLIPNVIPQLIVFATMGLGDVILAEATLSFLGLGIKYPAASWGSIVNAVNDAYVMTNYLFVWIPAGLLILLTVLAFNFIGDGLRDAFDPKMKR